MILIHNHPTGDPTPSKTDIKITDKLYNAAAMFDIELLDHIVIGNGSFKSVFAETKKIVDKLKENKMKGKEEKVWNFLHLVQKT
mgnify:CR=1 FL=1